jgi:hypothetical protein
MGSVMRGAFTKELATETRPASEIRADADTIAELWIRMASRMPGGRFSPVFTDS